MAINNRTTNTLKNIGFGFISKIVNLILPFIIRTVIIYKLGAEYTGLSSLFTSILQVLSVTELGFSSAIVYNLYKPISEGSKSDICEWLTLYRWVYHRVGWIILFAGLILTFFLNLVIKGDYPNDINIYVLFLIYLMNTVISYFAFSYKNVLLIGYQRRDILSNIEMAVSILRSVIQIIILVLFQNYYFFVMLIPLSTIILNIIVEIVTRVKFPDLVCGNFVDKNRLKLISKQVTGVAIGRISLIARNSFDSIILSAVCGLTTVVVYSNYYFIFNAVGQILGVIISSMVASIGNSLVTESLQKNYEDHNKFDFIYMWIVGWCTICLFCLYQPFMKMWVGAELVAPNSTMYLFCIYFYVNQLAQIRSAYSEAAGLWWKFRYIVIAEMIANVVLNFVLGFYFEMNGILIATIVTSFFSSFVGISIIVFRDFFKKRYTGFFLNNLFYFCSTALALCITYFIIRHVYVEGLVGLLLKVIICGVSPNIVYSVIYLCIPRYKNIILWGIKNVSIIKCL